MAKKKDHKTAKSKEQEALNKRVDAIMDPRITNPEASQDAKTPPIDIFKDAPDTVSQAAKTAPDVPGELLKNVDTGTIRDQPSPSPPPKPQKAKLTPKPEEMPQSADVEPFEPDETTELDARETDEAVSDIAAKEADTMLALQDAIGRKASNLAGDLAKDDKRIARRKKWTLFILLIIAGILFLLAVPHIAYTCHWPVGIRLRFTTDILPSVCK